MPTGSDVILAKNKITWGQTGSVAMIEAINYKEALWAVLCEKEPHIWSDSLKEMPKAANLTTVGKYGANQGH